MDIRGARCAQVASEEMRVASQEPWTLTRTARALKEEAGLGMVLRLAGERTGQTADAGGALRNTPTGQIRRRCLLAAADGGDPVTGLHCMRDPTAPFRALLDV